MTADELARAALRRDGLGLRSLAQDLLRGYRLPSEVPPPECIDQQMLVAAAALVELLAQRTEQAPPAWTGEIGAAPTAMFLVTAAERMPHLRRLCEEESPAPLKKRGLFAPPDFLSFA